MAIRGGKKGLISLCPICYRFKTLELPRTRSTVAERRDVDSYLSRHVGTLHELHCNVLRDDGMSYGDYVEQLTYLLFLKMADERTKPPYNQPSAVSAKYNWPALLKKDGDDLFDHYRHMLESLGKDFSPSPPDRIIRGQSFPLPLRRGTLEKNIVRGKRAARPN